jgi:hypothetical protein
MDYSQLDLQKTYLYHLSCFSKSMLEWCKDNTIEIEEKFAEVLNLKFGNRVYKRADSLKQNDVKEKIDNIFSTLDEKEQVTLAIESFEEINKELIAVIHDSLPNDIKRKADEEIVQKLQACMDKE